MLRIAIQLQDTESEIPYPIIHFKTIEDAQAYLNEEVKDIFEEQAID